MNLLILGDVMGVSGTDALRLNLVSIIKKKSVKNKIDPKITNRIWKNMIWAYIEYEKRNFKKK